MDIVFQVSGLLYGHNVFSALTPRIPWSCTEQLRYDLSIEYAMSFHRVIEVFSWPWDPKYDFNVLGRLYNSLQIYSWPALYQGSQGISINFLKLQLFLSLL